MRHPAIATLCALAIGLAAGDARAQAAAPTATPAPANVAILLFDGVQGIDYAGPYEVFLQAIGRRGPAFHVYTVAESERPVRIVGGLRVVPDYTFASAPRPEIVVVPGGGSHRRPEGVGAVMASEPAMAWLRSAAASADTVLSVCNGAFVLARGGLLDGKQVTTNALALDQLALAAPTAKVLPRRFVDSGKVVTTGGLSAGIDGALHVVDRRLGRATAELVARAIEYDWDPDARYAAAELADAPLIRLLTPLLFGLDATPTSFASSRDGSAARLEVTGAAVTAVRARLDDALAQAGWKAAADGTLSWTDPQHAGWSATVGVHPGEDGRVEVALELSRHPSR